MFFIWKVSMSIVNLCIMLEARSKTLRTPQNVSARILSWPDDPVQVLRPQGGTWPSDDDIVDEDVDDDGEGYRDYDGDDDDDGDDGDDDDADGVQGVDVLHLESVHIIDVG